MADMDWGWKKRKRSGNNVDLNRDMDKRHLGSLDGMIGGRRKVYYQPDRQ